MTFVIFLINFPNSAKFQRHRPTFVFLFRIRHPGSFFRPEHVPVRVVIGLGIFLSGLLGAIRDSESLSAGALARRGGPGTWRIFSSVAGRADGP